MRKYNVIAAVWFSPASPPMTIGVVAIARDHDAKEWKAYIGLAAGADETRDKQFIAANGAKISNEAQAAAFFPELDIKGFVV